MNIKIKKIIFFIMLHILFFSSSLLLTASDQPLIGIKIYNFKGNYEELFNMWQKLKINTAFIGTDLITDKSFLSMAKKNNITTFAIIPIFYNPEKLKQDPTYFALNGQGSSAKLEWVEFVCPSRADYQKERIEFIKNIIKESNPDGLSIDFIRFFAYWEKIYPDMVLNPLHNTCFCDHCLARMQRELAIKFPGHIQSATDKTRWIIKHHFNQWVKWKCQLITDTVKNIVQEVKKLKPNLLINIHIVPWRKNDFNQAIRNVVSQDISALSPYVDYISPMCYAHMVKQPPAWIHEVVEDFSTQTKKKIIPSIQVSKAYLNTDLTKQEFSDFLVESLKPPSSGVVFWNWESLEQETEKQKAVIDCFSDPH